MKQILLVPGIFLMLMLSGCTVSPSVLGGNIAGIGSGASQENQQPTILNAPAETGSIVPLGEEGAVVYLPDSSAQTQASSTAQHGPTSSGAADRFVSEDEKAVSADERHRRELINRGDLREGQPLPLE
ncbi:MAG: hypothetical protein GY927_02780 [bacterium]|nr:hypothetical protein [bacterium]